MKNKLGKISGFIVGMGGFLLLFKIVFLNNVAPQDELAPGIVVLIAVAIGILISYTGGRIQERITRA